MFSNLYKKAALFGASAVASVAFTGMASSAEAATMTYRSEFGLTANSLQVGTRPKLENFLVLNGDFSFTKTELNSGKFSYKLTDFNLSLAATGTLTLNDIQTNSDPFLAINQALIPQKYQDVLPSVLAGEDSNYVGDGDFPPDDFTYEFTGQEFRAFSNQLTPLLTAFLESTSSDIDIDSSRAEELTGALNVIFAKGGKFSLQTTSTTTASVPEPASILGLGIVGVGLVTTRRKRAVKKIKQKTAA
ncbi:MAG: PEP-CTERM sorting domain-containing protein [Rivularia sp. (in: Bacteria)]|nr:PEP-CTERM sorting domain-containing protein [Rivularia sp. MS3]